MYLSVISIFLCINYIYCNSQDASEHFFNESLDINLLKKFDKSPNSGYQTKDRSSRFLSFNNDASNIRVEMVFAVPFLAIPIGGKPDPVNQGVVKPHLDINIKSLTAMAGLMVMLFFVIPKIVGFYFPPARTSSESEHHSRESTVPNGIDTILERIDEVLHTHSIDFQSCAQKVICWTLSNASKKVKLGKASGADKLLDAVSNFYPFKYILEDTWLWDLIENAIHSKETENGSCQKFSERCSVTQNGLNNAAGSLLAAIKARNK